MLNDEITAQALVAYKHTKTGRLDFTSHEVIALGDTGQFTLGAGRAFTEEDKDSLVDVLLNADDVVEFISPSILVKSRRMLVWYTQPQVIDVLFREVSHQAPIPGLIFIATYGKLRCYAFTGDSRPTPETKLFYAPLGNMYESGSFCTGNCVTPKDVSINSIPGWEQFVLQCVNTHTGGKTVLKSHASYEGMVDFYKGLADTQTTAFPNDELVPVTQGDEQCSLKDALASGVKP